MGRTSASRRGYGRRSRRPPAEVRLASGARFVQPADRRGVRGALDYLGLACDLFVDLVEGLNEEIERGLRLGLGGLDHQGLGNDQGKVDRWGVEPKVD